MARRPHPPEAKKAARRAGLVYVDDARPGITRVRAGKGFRYRRASGVAVHDDATLARIRKLAIPPAWRDVWISPRPRGHVQATGRDARGRKQYRYHPDWVQERDGGKFARALDFGKAMPKLRRRVREDLKTPGFPQDKVSAIVLSVLAETMIRVGNSEYARDNGSFGLTTLRDRHAEFLRGGRVRFRFRGKSGQDHEVVLDDARLAKLVRGCQQLPGQTLFQYRNGDGRRRKMTSTLVNAYLREAMDGEFTTKDFRTYAGTVAAFRMLAGTPLPKGRRGHPPGESAFAAAEKQVVRQIAEALGNTPAVCRKAYIDPAVFEGWRDGRVQRAGAKARGARQWEAAAQRFLRAAHRGR